MELTVEKLEQILLDHEDRLISQFKTLLERPKSIRITQKVAYDIYGRTKVINWRLQGLLKTYKIGRTVEYEVAVLDKLMENRQLIIERK